MIHGGIVMYENVLVLRPDTLKYLMVKRDNVINSLFKSSKQIMCYIKERENNEAKVKCTQLVISG